MRLIITEKPSVAKTIAQALGKYQYKEDYYQVGDYKITWAYGHLLTLKMPEDYDEKYKLWRLDDLPIIPKRFEYKPISKDHKKRLDAIKKLWKEADTVYCATDAGREGELIFRLIQQYVGIKKPIKRVWLQTLTPAGIKDAIDKAKDIKHYDNLYQAGLQRSLADWVVGINLTRAVTIKQPGKQVYSIGRVQTPTLAIIVRREREISKFSSKTSYRPILVFDDFELKCEKTFPTEAEALQFVKPIHEVQLTFTTKQTKDAPALLPSLANLQKEMSWKAKKTLDTLQSLYEKQLVSYPRTDSNYLPEDMPSQVQQIASLLGDNTDKQYATKPYDPKRIYDNSKVSDHYAVIPLAKPGTLTDDEKQLFEYVTKRFLSAFYPPAVNTVQTISFEYKGVKFSTQRVSTKEPSWYKHFPDKIKSDKFIPKRDTATVVSTKVEKVKTNPPPRWTDSTLIDAMEHAGRFIDEKNLKDAIRDKGIGTPATRADIIERLINVGYVERNKRALVPTDKGIILIQWLEQQGMDELTKPELTAEWEDRLEQIAVGKEQPDKFLTDIIQWTNQLISRANAKLRSQSQPNKQHSR